MHDIYLPSFFLPTCLSSLCCLTLISPHPHLPHCSEHPSHLSFTFTLQHPQAMETVKGHQRPRPWASTGMQARMWQWAHIQRMLLLLVWDGPWLSAWWSGDSWRSWGLISSTALLSACAGWQAGSHWPQWDTKAIAREEPLKQHEASAAAGWWNCLQKHCCWCRLLSLHVLVFTGQQERTWKQHKAAAESNQKNMSEVLHRNYLLNFDTQTVWLPLWKTKRDYHSSQRKWNKQQN